MNKLSNEFKYFAFISYRHIDNDPQRDGLGNRWADWILEECESWRTPVELVGKECRHGKVPERCFPLFQDTKELPTNADLAESIRTALDQSRYLIVICSPRATESRYLNAEIIHFKSTGKTNAILPIIIDGEPNASDSDDPNVRRRECFPAALRYKVNEKGEILTGERDIEPVCADARGEDGKEIRMRDRKNAVILETAKLKLIAGILGVNFDELVQRDKLRQIRQSKKRFRNLMLFSIVIFFFFVMALMSAIWAWKMRQEAIHQRDVSKKNSEILIQNITPLAYYANFNTVDLKLTEIVNEFVSNCKGIFIPEYDPTSLKNSYESAQLCQLSANAIMASKDEAYFKTIIKGLPPSNEVIEDALEAMKYIDKMEEILEKIFKLNSPAKIEAILGQSVEFLKKIQSEALLARGYIFLQTKKLWLAQITLESFIGIMETWQGSEQIVKSKTYDLFEAYTHLSHVFRLNKNLEKARYFAKKSLENGMVAAKDDPAKTQRLLLRYAFFRYLELTDNDIKTKMHDIFIKNEINEEDFYNTIIQFIENTGKSIN